MSWISRALALVVILSAVCMAQDSLVTVVGKKDHHKFSTSELNKLYFSSFSAVQQEFGTRNLPMPPITLVIGADKDGVEFDKKTILLAKWDRGRFAEGVVLIAFEELLTRQKRIEIVSRAVRSADATIDVSQFIKK